MATTSHTPPRSVSRTRKKRSTTNLADLRLAPLSTRFAQPAAEDSTQPRPRSPYEERADVLYARQHPSYLHGRSAPSTPGILSRSSSRRHLGAGLSRRTSLYDEAHVYQYNPVMISGESSQSASGHIPKAKSEAALHVATHSAAAAGQRRRHPQDRARSGASTPRASAKYRDDEDWLARTRAVTHEALQEAKGQTWTASRDSSTTLTHLQSDDDDDDEGYEELAALSASQARLQSAPHSPVSARIRSPMWGSRYGSRQGSRRTSRRGSVSGAPRTPLAHVTMLPEEDYFTTNPPVSVRPDFRDVEESDADETDDAESEVARLSKETSRGFGGIFDRIMRFGLFGVPEDEEDPDDEKFGNETEDEAKMRRTAEAKRKFEEEDKAAKIPPAPEGLDGQPRWQEDAAWLLGIASKAFF